MPYKIAHLSHQPLLSPDVRMSVITFLFGYRQPPTKRARKDAACIVAERSRQMARKDLAVRQPISAKSVKWLYVLTVSTHIIAQTADNHSHKLIPYLDILKDHSPRFRLYLPLLLILKLLP